MADTTLKWDGRAPLSKRIPDEQWDKHKDLICRLRPTMKLVELVEVMETEHGFRATGRQYRSRFQKWGLPNLEAFVALEQIFSGNPTSIQETNVIQNGIERDSANSSFPPDPPSGEAEILLPFSFENELVTGETEVQRSTTRQKTLHRPKEPLSDSQAVQLEEDWVRPIDTLFECETCGTSLTSHRFGLGPCNRNVEISGEHSGASETLTSKIDTSGEGLQRAESEAADQNVLESHQSARLQLRARTLDGDVNQTPFKPLDIDALLAIGCYELSYLLLNAWWAATIKEATLQGTRPVGLLQLPLLLSTAGRLSLAVNDFQQYLTTISQFRQVFQLLQSEADDVHWEKFLFQAYTAALHLRFKFTYEAAESCLRAWGSLGDYLGAYLGDYLEDVLPRTFHWFQSQKPDDVLEMTVWRMKKGRISLGQLSEISTFIQLSESVSEQSKLDSVKVSLRSRKSGRVDYLKSLTGQCYKGIGVLKLLEWGNNRLLDDKCRDSCFAALQTAANGDSVPDATSISLSSTIFCHLWQSFRLLCSQPQSRENDSLVYFANEVAQEMGASEARVFATISLVFSEHSSYGPTATEEFKTSQWSKRKMSELLKDTHNTFHYLLTFDNSRSKLFNDFLDALRHITLNRLEKCWVPLEYRKAFVRNCLDPSHPLPASKFNYEMSCQPDSSSSMVMKMPSPYLPCPSVTSSGIRSMQSIQERIRKRQFGHESIEDHLSDRMSGLSFRSSALRSQLGLTGAEYRTLSSLDSTYSRSINGSAMEWEFATKEQPEPEYESIELLVKDYFTN